jgi:hypothetical protein
VNQLAPALITPPAAQPVTLTEVKEHLRVVHGEQDAHILSLIGASVRHLDGRSGVLGRCIMPQTWRSYSASLADLRLPFGDAQSAVVKYYDTANLEQTLPGSTYMVLNDAGGGFIRFDPMWTLPAVFDRPDAVRVDAVYAMRDADLEAVRLIVKLMVQAQFFVSDTTAAVEALLGPLRMRAL